MYVRDLFVLCFCVFVALVFGNIIGMQASKNEKIATKNRL